jgi:hypothetical protein
MKSIELIEEDFLKAYSYFNRGGLEHFKKRVKLHAIERMIKNNNNEIDQLLNSNKILVLDNYMSARKEWLKNENKLTKLLSDNDELHKIMMCSLDEDLHNPLPIR